MIVLWIVLGLVVVLLIWGISTADSSASEISEFFTGSPTDKAMVLAHKAAIDAHLKNVGIPIFYTNVFWGGRSEIKPSEISPFAYRDWCRAMGLDPAQMHD